MINTDFSLLLNSDDLHNNLHITDDFLLKKYNGKEYYEFFLDDGDYGFYSDFNEKFTIFVNNIKVKKLLNIEAYKFIRIGVFFDTANSNFFLDKYISKQFSNLNIDVVFSMYPCSADD